jgi:hypothetical protein
LRIWIKSTSEKLAASKDPTTDEDIILGSSVSMCSSILTLIRALHAVAPGTIELLTETVEDPQLLAALIEVVEGEDVFA